MTADQNGPDSNRPSGTPAAAAEGQTASGSRLSSRWRARPVRAPRRKPTGEVRDAAASDAATSDATTGDAQRPPRPARRPRTTKPTAFGQRLSETAGPDPQAALDEVRLSVGRIAGAFGVRGEMKLDFWTDTPENLRRIKRVWLDDEVKARRLIGVRFHGDRALIRIAGINTPEQARELTGTVVRIAGRDAKPLEEGEYYLFQLIGLKALTEDGEEIGTVTDLMETGANDVLVITPPGGGQDVLYPNHPEFVVSVDPQGGTIVVRRMEYLS